MNVTILPADTYTVLCKSIITDLDRKLITFLYQPIIGYTAVSLYFTLLDDLEQMFISEDFTHHHLMATMQLKLEKIIEAREKLEAAGLLKTYLKRENVNNYAYLIFAPLSASEFLNHPILNVVLYNNLGKTEYDKIVKYFRAPRISLKEYTDVSKKFSDVFQSTAGSFVFENEDVLDRNSNRLQIVSGIDLNLLIESIPKNMVHEKCFTPDVLELLENLSYVYKLDMDVLIGLVRDHLNERGFLDKTEFRKACRNYYQFENSGRLPTVVYKTQPEYLRTPKGDTSKKARLIYTFETTTPYDFLASKCKSGEPSSRDMRLIEELMVDFKLNPGVVNVLIAYVLHINNKKLNKNYVETIAGQWQRIPIETVEEALELTQKEYKKQKKKQEVKQVVKNVKTSSKESLPVWFDKEIDSMEISAAEEEEMSRLLKEMI